MIFVSNVQSICVPCVIKRSRLRSCVACDCPNRIGWRFNALLLSLDVLVSVDPSLPPLLRLELSIRLRANSSES